MSAKYSRIISTGSALPAARITNEDLARRLAADGIETSDEWIRTRTGIEARRFVNGTTETTTTLAQLSVIERFQPICSRKISFRHYKRLRLSIRAKRFLHTPVPASAAQATHQASRRRA